MREYYVIAVEDGSRSTYIKGLREGLNGDWYYDPAWLPEQADHYSNIEDTAAHLEILRRQHLNREFHVERVSIICEKV